MLVPETPPTDTHWLDHELFRGEDGDGTEYLMTKYSDGLLTLACRTLGARTWGPPVILRGVS